MKPKQIVEQWVGYFNDANIDGLCSLYHENAVNHQVVTEPLEGIAAIRKLFETEFARAEMICNIEMIHEAGDWAIMEWIDPLGLRGCGFFHIINGKIAFQRGYFDQLSFFRIQGLDVPDEYLKTDKIKVPDIKL